MAPLLRYVGSAPVQGKGGFVHVQMQAEVTWPIYCKAHIASEGIDASHCGQSKHNVMHAAYVRTLRNAQYSLCSLIGA